MTNGGKRVAWVTEGAGRDIASTSASFQWEDWEQVLIKKIQNSPAQKVAVQSEPAQD